MSEAEDKIVDTDESVETKAGLEDSTHVSTSEDEGRKSTIGRIAEILRGKKTAETTDDGGVENEPEDDTPEEVHEDKPETEVDDGQEPPVEDKDTDTDEYDEIDPRFVAAARGYGWSDSRIVAYAESHDDKDVVTMTGLMERTVPAETEVETAEEKPIYQSVLDQIEANEEIGEPVKQLLKSLVTDLQSTKAQLSKVTTASEGATKAQQQKEWLDRFSVANEQFDTAAKEFTELGQTTTLKRLPDGSLNPNDPAVKTREDLFKMAAVLFQSGSSWEKAVKDSLRWYKGGREDVVEAKVLQKIKANSKRLSPKREQRHQVKKYASEIEEKGAVVNQALAKYGIELPQ